MTAPFALICVSRCLSTSGVDDIDLDIDLDLKAFYFSGFRAYLWAFEVHERLRLFKVLSAYLVGSMKASYWSHCGLGISISSQKGKLQQCLKMERYHWWSCRCRCLLRLVVGCASPPPESLSLAAISPAELEEKLENAHNSLSRLCDMEHLIPIWSSVLTEDCL